MEEKRIYKIIRYIKRDYKQYNPNDDRISIDSDEVNLSLNRISGAMNIAKMAGLKDFEIKCITLDKEGYERRNTEAILYTTPSVRAWKLKVKLQDEARDKRKDSVIKKINALPLKVTLYKKDDILITAKRDIAEPNAYRGLDIKYQGIIFFKGKEVSWGLSSFITENEKIRGRKLAEELYQRENTKKYRNTAYDTWKQVLQGLPEEYIDKHKEILRTALHELNKWQNKIEIVKRRL